MAVFRVNKTQNYTVMSNHHLRDKKLSNKACGLLSKMLSLPDEWDYTTRGLAAICKDGVDAIGSALKELENCGYLVRHRVRDDKGRITDVEYIIYETPHVSIPSAEHPDTENPDMDKPCLDNPAQLKKEESNTNSSSTKESNTQSFFPSVYGNGQDDGLTDGETMRMEIMDQIDYDILTEHYDRAQVEELAEIMLEVAMNRSQTIKLGRDAEYPTRFVQRRFEKINFVHVQKVLDGIAENTTRVRNTKAYLMAALFNAVSTLDNDAAMRVNHDFYGS